MLKELSSSVAVLIAVFGTGPYIVGMLRGRIKPHAFTWLVWATTTFIAFVGQLVGGGGIGSAASGASAAVCLAVSLYAFWRGDRAYTRLDWICLGGAGAALIPWALSGGPLTTLILIALMDAIGSVPTIRKAYVKPDEEGISTFVLSTFKWLLAIYALDHLNVLTLLFPATTTAVNAVIIAVVLVRRAQLRTLAAQTAASES